jgi:formate dehydrogenase iron-sulfur subunit
LPWNKGHYISETENLATEDIIGACPYDIPRSAKNGVLAKCTMCNDRVKKAMEPACVKTCPTGTMNFGELEEMQAMAFERIKKVKLEYPDARLLDQADVRVIFLTAFAPEKYHKHAVSFDPKSWNAR